MEISARPCSAAKPAAAGSRAMDPSSLTTSTSTPTGAQPGQPGQVDGGLGVAGALEHAAGAGAQREDVAGPAQVARPGARGAQHPDGVRAVGGADAGAHALARVHGHGEGGALAVLVHRGHRRQLEPVGPLVAHRDAHDAAGVADGEGEQLLGGVLGREDQVALVLPVLVVHDEDRTAGREFEQARSRWCRVRCR